MNVGIVLKSRDPKEGGGYTITYDILEKLLDNKKLINHNLYFVVINYLNPKIKSLFKKNKIKYINIYENEILSKIKNLVFCKINFLLKAYNFLKLNKIDIYFRKNNVKIIWPISSELRYPFSIPFFFTIWDLQHRSIPQYKEVGSIIKRSYRELLIKTNLDKAKYTIVGTKVGANEIKKYYNIKKDKIILNSHPTPSWARQKKINNKNFIKKISIKNYFLYPANFWSHKNHLNLIKGFELFLKKNKIKYQLIFVGSTVDEEVYDEIKNYIYKQKLSTNIKILGYVSRNELLSLYDNCIALTYLSVSGPENLPPLEAFARGKPVLYSNFDGAKEQLYNYPVYVNPYKPEDIAKGVSKILKKKNLSKFYKNFSKKKTTEKYISKINTILKSA
jgi:glycosyltransferase involved in cell wall biosynthesis